MCEITALFIALLKEESFFFFLKLLIFECILSAIITFVWSAQISLFILLRFVFHHF